VSQVISVHATEFVARQERAALAAKRAFYFNYGRIVKSAEDVIAAIEAGVTA
jgi:hypothetical protein